MIHAILLSAFLTDASLIVGGNALDLGSTRYAMAHCPGCVESNPIMGQSLAQQLAVKSLASGVMILGVRELRKSGHPRAARVMAVSVCVLGATAAGWNLYQTRRRR